MNLRMIGIGTVTFLAGLALGWVLFGGHEMSAESGAATGGDAREPLYWVAPMDPDDRRDGPGKSPMGMDLVPVYEDDGAEAGVRVSPEVQHNFGVRLASVRRAPLDDAVQAVGSVALAESLVEHVHTRTSGWIERLAANVEGDPVARGDLLLELYSPELVRAQEEFLLAAEPALRRASRERLRALGMTAAQIDALSARGTVSERIELRAARDGFVMDLSVREGMYVEPRTEVLAVAGLDPVWVLAEVFERDAPRIAAGQRAELAFDFLPGRTFEGEIDYLYPTFDVERRTLRVRMVFANPDRSLRPGMFGNVRIRQASEDRPLTIPAAALIRGTGDAPDRVVVCLAEDRFRSRAVRVGRVLPDRVEILAGLREGESVVVSGQFLIDSESDVDADLARMGAREAGAAMDHSGMDHSGMDHARMDHSGMDHSGMDHSEMDHSGMDHSGMDHSEMDHSEMDHSEMDHSEMDHSEMDHSGMDHSEMDHSKTDHGDMPEPRR